MGGESVGAVLELESVMKQRKSRLGRREMARDDKREREREREEGVRHSFIHDEKNLTVQLLVGLYLFCISLFPFICNSLHSLHSCTHTYSRGSLLKPTPVFSIWSVPSGVFRLVLSCSSHFHLSIPIFLKRLSIKQPARSETYPDHPDPSIL
jgi:hypothetical protein